MKSPFVDGLVPNEPVTAQFLVLSKEIRQKKTGESYLTLHLGDRTGEIEAKMWDNVAEVMHTFERDHFVKVKGLPQLYQNRTQFVIHRLRRLEDHEVDFADFFPCSERDPGHMFAELEGIISGMRNVHLRELLQLIFSDPELSAAYRVAPAAKNIHHACRGGLLEHVLSLCALGRLMAGHYTEVDLDLLLTGAILHDIGKVEELSYERSFGYSSDGQLLGHIVLGLRYLSRQFDQLPAFPPKLRMLVEHMVISHHGELQFGSPKVPMFAEALLLHQLDNLDSKMNSMRNAFKREANVESEFTGWIASMERVLLKKDRYLREVQKEPATVIPQQVSAVPETKAQDPKPEPVSPVGHPPLRAEHVPPAVPAPHRVEHAFPARPATPLPNERKPEPQRAPMNTLLGEKLQAVLEGRK